MHAVITLPWSRLKRPQFLGLHSLYSFNAGTYTPERHAERRYGAWRPTTALKHLIMARRQVFDLQMPVMYRLTMGPGIYRFDCGNDLGGNISISLCSYAVPPKRTYSTSGCNCADCVNHG